MDKRYAQMSPAEQVERRREVLSHIQARPELSV
ncbi:MAG TPA: XRE family transcriptional regulator, partial [Alcanivorax sp.]|nr:XRE family transcriptional regulator [Alcanivorax sp.]